MPPDALRQLRCGYISSAKQSQEDKEKGREKENRKSKKKKKRRSLGTGIMDTHRPKVTRDPMNVQVQCKEKKIL